MLVVPLQLNVVSTKDTKPVVENAPIKVVACAPVPLEVEAKLVIDVALLTARVEYVVPLLGTVTAVAVKLVPTFKVDPDTDKAATFMKVLVVRVARDKLKLAAPRFADKSPDKLYTALVMLIAPVVPRVAKELVNAMAAAAVLLCV